MKVYIYFEDLPGIFAGERELLERCVTSWRRHGWTPVVLGREHAEKHRFFKTMQANHDLVHGTQHEAAADWERCSYFRWLALEMVGSANAELLIDYDMINYGYRASKEKQDGMPRGYGGVNLHAKGQFTFPGAGDIRPPTPMWIGPNSLASLTMRLTYFELEEDWPHKQVTDQLIIHEHGEQIFGLTDGPVVCNMYGSKEWKTSPIVHYTHWSIAEGHTANRALFIEGIEKTR